MQRVRWGIIGCGDVTENKSGPGFQKAAGSKLVAVMRRNPDLAADYARRHGVPKWYSYSSETVAACKARTVPTGYWSSFAAADSGYPAMPRRSA